MDLKNATILLIFTLCVLGLVMGIYYTEASESSQDTADYEEVVHVNPNGTITINMEPKNTTNQTKLSGFFT